MNEVQQELIVNALAAVAGFCDAVQIPHEEWPLHASALAKLGILAGAEEVQILGAQRIGDTAAVPASYIIYTVDSEPAGKVSSTTEAAYPRHLVQTGIGADLGRVFMRPESLGDKISESYNQIEVDFDAHPEFSNKYYVLAEHEERFRANVTAALLDAIGELDGLVIEISGSMMTATFERPVNEQDAVALARLAIVATVR